MKSIFLSIRPEWLCKILNREKTIEVRKLFPKDYVGWVCLYCSKGNDRLWKENDHYWHSTKVKTTQNDLNGKVVARFWCNKVEEIKPSWQYLYHDKKDLLKSACLTEDEFDDYVGLIFSHFFTIHISKLEIFDKPKELSEFHTVNKYGIPQYQFGNGTCDYKKLTKAPQNYCYVEA